MLNARCRYLDRMAATEAIPSIGIALFLVGPGQMVRVQPSKSQASAQFNNQRCDHLRFLIPYEDNYHNCTGLDTPKPFSLVLWRTAYPFLVLRIASHRRRALTWIIDLSSIPPGVNRRQRSSQGLIRGFLNLDLSHQPRTSSIPS